MSQTEHNLYAVDLRSGLNIDTRLFISFVKKYGIFPFDSNVSCGAKKLETEDFLILSNLNELKEYCSYLWIQEYKDFKHYSIKLLNYVDDEQSFVEKRLECSSRILIKKLYDEEDNRISMMMHKAGM